MNWVYESVKCILGYDRKYDNNIIRRQSKENIPLNDENFKLIKECSWMGCGLEFYDKRPIFMKAKLSKRYYAFCSEECYTTWLRSNYLFY